MDQESLVRLHMFNYTFAFITQYLNFFSIIGYVTHSFLIYLGIANFNWVFKFKKNVYLGI